MNAVQFNGLMSSSNFITFKMDPLSIEIGVRNFPFLADHGFQEMVVLPGSFYLQLALNAHKDYFHGMATGIARIEFRTPVVLSGESVNLSLEIIQLNEETIECNFRDASRIDSSVSASMPCATLEIRSSAFSISGQAVALPNLAGFQSQAQTFGEQDTFYRRLNQNGNQYGPHFQSVRQLWLKNDELIARLSVSRNTVGSQASQLDTILMDGAVQVLAAFLLDYGYTFVLKSIDEITLLQPKLPEDVWVHARLRTRPSGDFKQGEGDVDIFDCSGSCLLRACGVRFAYIQPPETRGKVDSLKTEIVVSSNFTAEPVEDSLLFWADHFNIPVKIKFSPYNQVFQELLNPSSLLQGNKTGINVILLNLGDWVSNNPATVIRQPPPKIHTCFNGLQQHLLPNGFAIAHLNRHETEYVYKEIFVDKCYLRHGIQLPEDATIIDIGANIGLFTLFIRTQHPSASVYAFEPSPVAYRTLKANCEAYGPQLHPFNFGISDRRGSATLTFYEKSSVFSSFYPSLSEDRKAIQAVVANVVRGELRKSDEYVDEYIADLMRDRLEGQLFECPLITVSDIINDNKLNCVDLLKVDAEKCELEILRGIEAKHWPLIRQIVVEVHDPSRKAVSQVQELLARQGFDCAVEEENLLAGSGLFNVYGTRPGLNGYNSDGDHLATSGISGVQGKVDEFIQALQSFTQSASVPTLLCFCPAIAKFGLGEGTVRELLACENQLIQAVEKLSNVETIGSDTTLSRYHPNGVYDHDANELGHVPYTTECFAAIGSSLFRKIVNLRRLPYKVIVLDCDNTLWRGACGEEGPNGVEVTREFYQLQQFMVCQMNAGMILCLCSKNNADDVWNVFEQNSGMVLKCGHFAATRINWITKSENIRSLARELNLGLDTMIFLDDNPVECAEVRVECPEVLTLQLPSVPGRLIQFLEHSWAFDHVRLTQDDCTRTQKLLENFQREKYRRQTPTLKDFIQGLDLKVDVSVATRDQISRVSQLTLRTNQFNFTTIRRSESEVLRFLDQESSSCLVARVSDRFGDYGLVGVVLYREAGDVYDVETLLLSCRVLGRGVEHEVLAQLGRLAIKRAIPWVRFRFQASKKNLPAWEFLSSIGAEVNHPTDGVAIIEFPAAQLAVLCYDPELSTTKSINSRDRVAEIASTPLLGTPMIAPAGRSILYQRIADELNDANVICFATEDLRLRSAGKCGTESLDDSAGTLSGNILRIWQRVIGNPRIGVHDNFVDVGGTSLKAIQIIATIRRELKFDLSITNLFECPTVQLLCEKCIVGHAPCGLPDDAKDRGARRKQRPPKRP